MSRHIGNIINGMGQPRADVRRPPQTRDNIAPESSSSSEDEMTIPRIISEKPEVKILREFMRANLSGIKSDEEKLFS